LDGAKEKSYLIFIAAQRLCHFIALNSFFLYLGKARDISPLSRISSTIFMISASCATAFTILRKAPLPSDHLQIGQDPRHAAAPCCCLLTHKWRCGRRIQVTRVLRPERDSD